MTNESDENVEPRGFPARVAKVLDDFTVVLNRGRDDGVEVGDSFVVFSYGDEDIIDPETGDSLGRLELVKGRGRVSHVQERIATLLSSTTREEPVQDAISVLGGSRRTKTVRVVFRDPEHGDYAKPIE